MPVLVDLISSEEEIVRFEEEYHLDFEVPCSIAHCRTPHKHGYLALLRDGNHARIGNVCGTHLLGENRFTSMQRELEGRQRRAALTRIISSPHFDPQAVFDGLRPWMPALNVVKAARVKFSDVRELIPGIRDAAASPLHRLPTANPDAPFVLRGGFFLIDTKVYSNMSAGIVSLKATIEAYNQPHFTERDLRLITTNTRDAHSKFSAVADIFDDYIAFRTPDNLQTLVHWSAQFSVTWVQRHSKGLRTGHGVVIALPELLGVDRTLLDRLKPD